MSVADFISRLPVGAARLVRESAAMATEPTAKCTHCGAAAVDVVSFVSYPTPGTTVGCYGWCQSCFDECSPPELWVQALPGTARDMAETTFAVLVAGVLAEYGVLAPLSARGTVGVPL